MDKHDEQIQRAIDYLVEYKEQNKVAEVSLERDVNPNIDGPGSKYGNKLYIKFTIED